MVLSAMERGLRQAGRFEPAWMITTACGLIPSNQTTVKCQSGWDKSPQTVTLFTARPPMGYKKKIRIF
jgi:hypothetical protein